MCHIAEQQLEIRKRRVEFISAAVCKAILETIVFFGK